MKFSAAKISDYMVFHKESMRLNCDGEVCTLIIVVTVNVCLVLIKNHILEVRVTAWLGLSVHLWLSSTGVIHFLTIVLI